MTQMIYRCTPENQKQLGCIHLEVMRRGNESCFHRTKNGFCARFGDRQVKEVVDKLGQLEEYGHAELSELDKLKQYLDERLIAYEVISKRTILLETKPVFVNDCPEGLTVVGLGFNAVWSYSAEFIARALDRKFREEMKGQ